MVQPTQTSDPNPRLSVIFPGDENFQDILSWEFPAEPFYLRQVQRALESDMPQRVLHEDGIIFGLHVMDKNSRHLIGFGAISQSKLYSEYADNRRHFYLPLLAARPDMTGRGFGKVILDHLISYASAEFLESETNDQEIADLIFLDVYIANPIRNWYTGPSYEFRVLNENNPKLDPDENNEPYYIMSRSLRLPGPESGLQPTD